MAHAQPLYQGSIIQDEEEFRLRTPSSVTAYPEKNEIYVASAGLIHVFTSDLFPLFTISKGRGIESATGMTFDKDGNFYVAQAHTREKKARISVLNPALMWERDIYFEGFPGASSFEPLHVAVDNSGYIYTVGNPSPDVIVMDNNGGFVEMMSAMEGETSVTVNDVVVDASGRIYVLSESVGHAYVYDENRNFLFKFGHKGGISGKLSRPKGIAVDMRGRLIYVVDYLRHAVSAFDYSDGTFLFEFGGMGWGEGWFQYPNDVDVDSVGRVIVSDTFNNRVQVFKPESLEPGVADSVDTERGS